jgi:D-lactate dehydrogenase
MKIAFFEQDNSEKKHIQNQLSGQHLEFFKEPLTKDNVQKVHDADIVSVFLNSKMDKELINKLPNLKLIATASTGFDHIDLQECKMKNIVVCNVPFYGINTVAEHTFALILCLSRNILKAYQKTLQHDHTIDGLKGFDIRGRTIGVIGTGNIGLHVIHIAKVFGMKVIAYDVHHNASMADILGFTYVSFDELLAQSDIITLHVPYNKHTHHLINDDVVKKMKKGAILINTSRGSVVDNEALIEGLDKHILSGVGLDVIEGEELIKEEQQIIYDPSKLENLGNLAKDHILLNKDNVVFTPHIGFYSKQAVERLLNTNIQNIIAFIQGKPQNVV